jgi:hypothetical protein
MVLGGILGLHTTSGPRMEEPAERDMIRNDSFFDAVDPRKASFSNPRRVRRREPCWQAAQERKQTGCTCITNGCRKV